MSRYIHPDNKASGNIVYNNNHVFSVQNGIVEVQDDDKPYNILAEHGFMREEDTPSPAAARTKEPVDKTALVVLS